MPLVDPHVMRWYGLTTASPALLLEPTSTQLARGHALTGGTVGEGRSDTSALLLATRAHAVTTPGLTGLTRTLAGQGQTPEGQGYVDLRVQGTPGVSGFVAAQFDLVDTALASPQERLGLSLDVAVVGGSLQGVSAVRLFPRVNYASGTGDDTAISRDFRAELEGAGERTRRLAVLSPSTLAGASRLTDLLLGLWVTQNVPVDLTVRLSRPQAERLTLSSFVPNPGDGSVLRQGDDWDLQALARRVALPGALWTVMLAANLPHGAADTDLPLLSLSTGQGLDGPHALLFANPKRGEVGLSARPRTGAATDEVRVTASPVRRWVSVMASADGEFVTLFVNGKRAGALPQPEDALTLARLGALAHLPSVVQPLLIAPGAADLGIPLLMPRNVGEAEAMNLHLRLAGELPRVPLPELWSDLL